MKKLIGLPLFGLAVPQALWLAMYKLIFATVQPVAGGEGESVLKFVYGLGAVIGFAAAIVMSVVWLGDHGIPDYESEQRRLKHERDIALRKIDEELGIPHIPVRR